LVKSSLRSRVGSWLEYAPCEYSGMFMFLINTSPSRRTQNASQMLPPPLRMDLISLPVSMMPASNRSRISNSKPAFLFLTLILPASIMAANCMKRLRNGSRNNLCRKNQKEKARCLQHDNPWEDCHSEGILHFFSADNNFQIPFLNR